LVLNKFRAMKAGDPPLTEIELSALLGGWEGYRLGTVGRVEPDLEQDRGEPEVWVELLPVEGSPMVCDRCGGACDQEHDRQPRWVRDLPILGTTTWLLIHRRRVNCPRCGPELDRLEWLERYSRVTRRLAESVARLCRVLPIKHVAEFFGLGYFAYYNESRTHMALAGDSPVGRDSEPPSRGDVIAVPQVGGLHHRYTRAA
jgi:transposase